MSRLRNGELSASPHAVAMRERYKQDVENRAHRQAQARLWNAKHKAERKEHRRQMVLRFGETSPIWYRAALEPLYTRVPPPTHCHAGGEVLGDDRTDEHVPSMALVRDRGPFGLMIVTQSCRRHNVGLIES